VRVSLFSKGQRSQIHDPSASDYIEDDESDRSELS